MIVWQAEGIESSVAIRRGSSGLAFFVNGKSDGNALADAGTQIMLGLLGGCLHPQPQNSLRGGAGHRRNGRLAGRRALGPSASTWWNWNRPWTKWPAAAPRSITT